MRYSDSTKSHRLTVGAEKGTSESPTAEYPCLPDSHTDLNLQSSGSQSGLQTSITQEMSKAGHGWTTGPDSQLIGEGYSLDPEILFKQPLWFYCAAKMEIHYCVASSW